MLQSKQINVPETMEDSVRSEQTDLLYRAMPVSVVFSIINACIIAFIQWDVIDHTYITIWLTVAVLVYLARGLVAVVYFRCSDPEMNTEDWLLYFLVGTFTAGIVWGGASLFLFPDNNIAHQAFLAFVIAGMSAGASSSLSARFEAALLFIVPTLLFLIIRLMMVGNTMEIMMMVMVVLFMIQILNSSRRAYINTWNNIALKLLGNEREKVLGESEDRFRSLVEHSVDAIFLHDQKGKFIDVNNRACESLGYTRAELLRMSVFDIEKGISQEKLDQLWSVMQKNKPVRLDGRHYRQDGTSFPVEINLGLFEKNNEKFILATVRDVSERRQREDALRESRQKLALHMEQTPLAVIGWDTDFRVTEWNPAAERIFGYSRDEAMGRHAVDLVVPENVKPHVDDIWKSLLGQKGGLRSTNENITRNGDIIFCEWYNTPLVDEKGFVIGVASLAQDITERKRTEEAMIQAKEDAENANRAKSEFLSRMSHELRTPMNAILGFSQLIRPELEDNEHKDYMDEIIVAGNHLLQLINEVLDLSRIESGTLEVSLEKIEFSNVLNECLLLLKPLADERSIEIINNLGDKPIAVRADYTRLKQVMINLLSNGIKYNREGGKVTISTVQTDSDYVRILVQDTGPGISKEKQAHLFKPFDRLGAEYGNIEGTGIGLVITKKLLALMGGSIGIDNTCNEGTCFWLDLKIAGGQVSITNHDKLKEHYSDQSGSGKVNGKKILYIEDNPANMKLVEYAMSRRPGIELLMASRPELGLDLAIVHHPELILLDINLPGMDGYQVMRKLMNNKSTADIPVVAVTANAMESDIARGKSSGFRDYLTKPINVRHLLSVIDSVLEN